MRKLDEAMSELECDGCLESLRNGDKTKFINWPSERPPTIGIYHDKCYRKIREFIKTLHEANNNRTYQ